MTIISSPLANIRACPICHHTESNWLHTPHFEKFEETSAVRSYDVVCCHRCGFTYATGIPEKTVFDDYVPLQSKSEYHHRYDPLGKCSQEQYRSLARWIGMHISQDLNLLNVGAGRGELLTQLRQVGFQNLTGLELSSDYVEFARTNYGLPMLVGDLQQRPFDIDPYDGLIMSEVLECVPDLNRCIEHMSSWLKPKGFVILEVSDAEFFGEEMNAPFQEFKAERINFFTDASLINLMQNHGFRPLAKRHHLCEKGNGTSRAMLTMIFQWGADKKEPVHEAASEQGIRRYLDRCKTEIDSETKLISQIVATQEPILVWGVGTLCQRLLATTDFKHANIVAFIDSDPQYHGKLMHHRQVLSPNDVINRFEPILIASWSQQDEIMHLIQKTLAMKNRIITLRPLPAKPE